MMIALLEEAWVSIAASRLRTFLAMLGIVIGVCSVVLMLAVGAGSRAAIEDAVAKLGSNLLIVTPGARDSKGIRNADFSNLNAADAEAISQLSSVQASGPATYGRSFQVAVGKENWNTQVTGVTPEFFSIRNWIFSAGDNFTERDIKMSTRVAIIGNSVATKLFAGDTPLGRTLRIGQLPFRIVGVLEAKGQGFDGRDQDDSVFIPLTTAQRKLFGDFWRESVPIIYVQALSRDTVDIAQEEIQDLLRTRHKVRPSEPDRFMIRNLTAISQTATETARALSILLGAIASISLVVGGIGIMNIMLVTVAERTREIGIRKAIGASKTHVMHQFLMEALIISGIGSLVGLLMGVATAYAAERWFGVPTQVGIWSVMLSLGVAALVGILAGVYPAQRAANLQPIEALRAVGA